jgi:hypothetical protein
LLLRLDEIPSPLRSLGVDDHVVAVGVMPGIIRHRRPPELVAQQVEALSQRHVVVVGYEPFAFSLDLDGVADWLRTIQTRCQ